MSLPLISGERVFTPYEIFPGVIVRPGEYRFTRFRNRATTATRRRLSGGFTVISGNYWSGSANEIETSVTYKIPPWFTISLQHRPNICPLAGGQFRRSNP